jgi:hypothetical protein
MEKVLLVYVIVMGAILMVLVSLLFQRGGESERRLAKVRVRIDDNPLLAGKHLPADNRRPARMEPQEEEYDPFPGQALLIGGALVILIILIGSLQ